MATGSEISVVFHTDDCVGLRPTFSQYKRPAEAEVLVSQYNELHPLRLIGDGFLVGPARCGDPAAQFDQILFRNLHLERSNGVLASLWSIALSIAQGDQTMAEGECDDRKRKIAK